MQTVFFFDFFLNHTFFFAWLVGHDFFTQFGARAVCIFESILNNFMDQLGKKATPGIHFGPRQNLLWNLPVCASSFKLGLKATAQLREILGIQIQNVSQSKNCGNLNVPLPSPTIDQQIGRNWPVMHGALLVLGPQDNFLQSKQHGCLRARGWRDRKFLFCFLVDLRQGCKG